MAYDPNVAITKDIINGWSSEDLRKAMADGKTDEINTVLSQSDVPEVVPTEDEAALAAAAQAEAERQAAETAQKEAERVAAEQAAQQAAADETARLKEAGITVEKDSSGNIVKLALSYQARDEAGNAIGRPTYLEAKTWPELVMKERTAHENAVRFAERIKKQKATFKKEETSAATLTDEQLLALQEDLKSEDREKAAKAAEEVRKNDEKLALAALNREKEITRMNGISLKWMQGHITDFYPCQANSDILTAYIQDRGLEWTADNLEIAFINSQSQLAQREVVAPAAPVPANNEPTPSQPAAAPIAPAPEAPPPAPVAQPAAPIAAANPPAPARRPGVNTGLVPGSQSGNRPTPGPVGLTKAEIGKWSGEQMRKEMRNPARRAEIERVLAGR